MGSGNATESDTGVIDGGGDPHLVVNWPGEWLIAQANPAKLGQVVSWIQEKGVRVYVPTAPMVRWYDGRRREWSKPIFSSYIFACVPEVRLRPDTLRDWHISKLIEVKDQGRLRQELGDIQLALQHGQFIGLRKGLVRGTPVVVVSGPLRGVQGIIERLLNRGRLLVRATSMDSSVELEFDSLDVQPIAGELAA